MFKRTISFVASLVFVVTLCSSTHTDTINFNQNLKDGDFLISHEKSYVLGFFTPGNSLGKRYVGIWNQKIPERMVLWVANRDNPVKGTSGILFIDSSGNLVIQDQKTKISFWNTSLSYPETGEKAYSAQLQDTGNLVLYHDPDRRDTAWQSFDYPTNTFFAFMKYGVDKKRGLNRFLTSWKSPDDPGTGEYSVRMELNGMPQAYMYKGSDRVWRPGSWNGIGWSGIPEMSRNFTPYNYTENNDEVTLAYWVQDPSIYTILVLNESGTLNRIIWQEDDEKRYRWVGFWYVPKDNCDIYNPCGAFGVCNPYSPGEFGCRCVPGFKPKSSHGCERNKTDVCKNSEFLKMTNMNVPDTENVLLDRTMGLKECEKLCRKNCSCTGYASPNISDGGTGCISWYGDLIDMREFTNGGQDVYIRVTSDLAQLVKTSNGLHRKRLIIRVVVPIILLILVIFCLTNKIRKGKKPQSNTSLQSYEGPAIGEEEAAPANVLIFDLNTIKDATDNFSDDNKLGEGGFGSVYKGKLLNEELIAVKRLKRTSEQGIEEFKNEVTLIARLQHRNLVRLLGCCVQQGEKMLVYEYMPNKALDNFIFDDKQGMSLDWRKRFEIISGIAQGLLYLHQDSRLRIIHRDLKASNVLLDVSMQPKISDFGMARIFGEEQIEANTIRVVGTYGYMSPEYAMEGHFSTKSDVFSFGVLLLEIVSGKKNKHKYKENSINLIGDAWDFWTEERALDIADPLLGECYDGVEVLRCIHVGLLCIQPFPNDRPTISEVIFMLSNDTQLPRPNRPEFIFRQQNTAHSSSATGENMSINSVSFTIIEGR